MKQYGRTVNFAGECALLLFHRDPDLAVVVLVLGAVLKPAGVAIQLHIDACGDLVVGVRGQHWEKICWFSPWRAWGIRPVQGNTAQVWAGMVRVVKPSGSPWPDRSCRR